VSFKVQGSGVQGFRGSEVLGSGVQRFRVQRFRGSGFRVQRFRVQGSAQPPAAERASLIETETSADTNISICTRPGKSRLNLRQAQVSNPLPQLIIALLIYEVSFSIRLTAFQASGGPGPSAAKHPKPFSVLYPLPFTFFFFRIPHYDFPLQPRTSEP
jgi:hypothetical protein